METVKGKSDILNFFHKSWCKIIFTENLCSTMNRNVCWKLGSFTINNFTINRFYFLLQNNINFNLFKCPRSRITKRISIFFFKKHPEIEIKKTLHVISDVSRLKFKTSKGKCYKSILSSRDNTDYSTCLKSPSLLTFLALDLFSLGD